MLRVMARENAVEFASSAMVELETVRAVVQAYAQGKVTLTPPSAHNRRDWRYAPSFARIF